jgi:DNA-directed RNA polymerase subunit RPC12/RpoP
MKVEVIPEDKMKAYMAWCKDKTSTVFCCDCGKMVEISLTPYYYDEENNDVYFASLCPECGGLIIVKE